MLNKPADSYSASTTSQVTRYSLTNGLAKRLARLTPEQEDSLWRDDLLNQLDGWLYKLEACQLAERYWVIREQWHSLRELIRIFNPDEARDAITTAKAMDLVYDMQNRLFGPEEEDDNEPVE